jgi:hypothetical protein
MSNLYVDIINPFTSGSTLVSVSASYAATASHAESVLSASYALNATNAVNATSASYALNATNAVNAQTASFATTSSFATNFTCSNINVTGLATVLSASIQYLEVIYQTSSVVYSSGSNTFGDAANDTQTLWGTVDIITGPTIITGSIRGNVTPLTIASSTASLNLATGSFFTLTLPTGSTHINPTNINGGQTINLILTTVSGSTVTFPSSVKQISGSAYTPTAASSTDVLTFLTPNNSTLLLSAVKNLV